MLDLRCLDDLDLLREAYDLECKKAAGRDGRGELPSEFWPTYSAFANTEGGVILLGVEEKKQAFRVTGVSDVARVRKNLFDLLNNRERVSANLLGDRDVEEVDLDGKTVMAVSVPRADRKRRPVHLTKNPFEGNTYRRLNEADCRVPDDDVRRMIAEQVEDSRDHRVLEGFGVEDLEPETLRVYRQVFANRDPDHPWNEETDRSFLRSIGAWRTDCREKRTGLTLAGLLMFGRLTSIQDELPNYMLDYQERPPSDADARWVDRVTLDGKWSGNLYDFHRKVYAKLTADLKVPFVLRGAERQEETPVHVALREALANALVHADYTGRAAVLVVRQPGLYLFRNPGQMRISVEQALRGGEPDGRNRTLQKMFRFVGIGEQGGTGVPRILKGWKTQHWKPPLLRDAAEPYEHTRLEMPMVSLVPEEVLGGLRERFGAGLDTLSEVERVALAMAASEGTVDHARLRAFSVEHPVDLTRSLHRLTQRGMLEQTGVRRGAVYHLPGSDLPTPVEVFGPPTAPGSPPGNPGSAYPGSGKRSPDKRRRSPDSGARSPDNRPRKKGRTRSATEQMNDRDGDGALRTDLLPRPVVDDLEALTGGFRERLLRIADEPRSKKRLPVQRFRPVILALCRDHYLTIRVLAEVVDRKPESLRDQHLKSLVAERRLVMAFPQTPTHERQAYTAANGLAEPSEPQDPPGHAAGADA